MRRAVVLTLCLLAAAASAAGAAEPLGTRTTVRALAASGTTAYAVVDARSAARPFTLKRWSGGSVATVGGYGQDGAEDPALAAGAAGVLMSWAEPISGGIRVHGQRVPNGPRLELATATGPPALALRGDGTVVAAYPDRVGDAAVALLPGIVKAAGPYDLPSWRAITSDAPGRRHRPVGVAVPDDDPLVLDLAQTRTRTTLRLEGRGAPPATIVAVRGVRTINASLAADDDTLAVAYVSGGRVRLATAAPRGAWRKRTLPGTATQPVSGTPVVALDGGEPVVVWTSRPRGLPGRELYAWSGGRTRRLTRTRGDEGQPFVAPRAGGGVFVAWTRYDNGRGTPLLRRLG